MKKAIKIRLNTTAGYFGQWFFSHFGTWNPEFRREHADRIDKHDGLVMTVYPRRPNVRRDWCAPLAWQIVAEWRQSGELIVKSSWSFVIEVPAAGIIMLTVVWLGFKESELVPRFVGLLREIGQTFPEAKGQVEGWLAAEGLAAKPAKHVTDKTRIRAKSFKELKDTHPQWSYHQLARHACEELKDNSITAESVRYAYRTLGWKWEWPKRIR